MTFFPNSLYFISFFSSSINYRFLNLKLVVVIQLVRLLAFPLYILFPPFFKDFHSHAETSIYYSLYFCANNILEIWPSVFCFKMRNVRPGKYRRPCCAHKQLITRTKHSKYTFVTLLKHCLPQNWIHDIFASSYCVSVRRQFCYNRFTVSNKVVSS